MCARRSLTASNAGVISVRNSHAVVPGVTTPPALTPSMNGVTRRDHSAACRNRWSSKANRHAVTSRRDTAWPPYDNVTPPIPCRGRRDGVARFRNLLLSCSVDPGSRVVGWPVGWGRVAGSPVVGKPVVGQPLEGWSLRESVGYVPETGSRDHNKSYRKGTLHVYSSVPIERMFYRLGRLMKVIGYVRVSTDKQDVGPEVQVAALREEAARNGWELEIRREEPASAKSLEGRPVLAQAMEDLQAHRADALAVQKYDRLSRSVHDFTGWIARAEHEGWKIMSVLDGVDTSTTMGWAQAVNMMTYSEIERRIISDRTRRAMAHIKATTGKHMGRPSRVPPAVVAQIKDMRRAGLTLQAVADALNTQGVPTPSGGRWWPSTVGDIAKRKDPELCQQQ